MSCTAGPLFSDDQLDCTAPVMWGVTSKSNGAAALLGVGGGGVGGVAVWHALGFAELC